MNETFVKVETKEVNNKVKLVFDRIWSTSIIVFDTLWGLLMAICCVAALWQSSDAISGSVNQMLMSAGILAVLNLINWYTRKLLKNW